MVVMTTHASPARAAPIEGIWARMARDTKETGREKTRRHVLSHKHTTERLHESTTPRNSRVQKQDIGNTTSLS